jgi:hypothetical protein
MFIQRAVQRMGIRPIEVPVFDPSKVKVVDAAWESEGTMVMGQCVMWVDFQSLLQRVREQDAVIDSMVSIWDRELMKEREHERKFQSL